MRFVDIINLTVKNPDAELWDIMHEVKRQAKEVHDMVMNMVRAGLPSESIQEECDNYKEIET